MKTRKGYWFIEFPTGAFQSFENSEKARNYIKHVNRSDYVLGRFNRKSRRLLFKKWIFINGKFKRVKDEN